MSMQGQTVMVMNEDKKLLSWNPQRKRRRESKALKGNDLKVIAFPAVNERIADNPSKLFPQMNLQYLQHQLHDEQNDQN